MPAERRALFAHCLTEAGLAWLWARLDDGHYEVGVPEEAALLTRGLAGAAPGDGRGAGSRGGTGAVRRPAALPAPVRRTARRRTPVAAVRRDTVSDAVDTLVRRRPNAAVEAQREALAVWQPFGDELLVHWLETA